MFIPTAGTFIKEEDNYRKLPIRYPKKEIDMDILKNFFVKYGKYPGKLSTINEIGPVWNKVLNQWTNSSVDVFKSLEEENLPNLKEIYENYYVQGVSEGASSGKAFENVDKGGNGDQYKQQKTQRNIKRFELISDYFNFNTKDIGEIYNLLLDKINIPQEPNIGQTWGWWYNNTFIHFELAEYIYLSDIIFNILKKYNLDKITFLGEGSGVLSSLIYSNYNVKKSYHIDLSHFLIKQYLNNVNNTNIHYYYAEDFKENTLCNSEILINQDSFPEMSDKSVYRYIKNAKFNGVSYILSYNKSTTFEGGTKHSDWKKILLSFGYVPKEKIKSIINEYYSIELFKLN